MTPEEALALAQAEAELGGSGPAAEPDEGGFQTGFAPFDLAATAAERLFSDEPVEKRGGFLPVGITESGKAVPALPEFAVKGFNAISDLLSGRRDATQVTGEEAFILGSLFAGVSPATGTGRAVAARGGATRGPTKTPVAQAAERIGVDLPRAVATESQTVQQAGKIVQSVPGGGTPLRKASEKAISQVGDAATRVERSLGSGNVVAAADTVRSGVTSFAGKGGVLASRAGARLDRVDALVNPNVTTKLSETAATVGKIVGRRGEAALSKQSEATKIVAEAINRPEGLSYQGIKTLRSRIGEMLDNPSLLPSNMSGAELKQIYAALTADLKSAVRAGGGERAVKVWEAANRAFEKTMRIRENLAKVTKTDNEGAIFSRIEGFAGITGRADLKSLAQVRAAVGKDGWGEVSSALVSRLGRDAEGNFSPQRFLTAWGKISDGAKKILFAENKQHAQALDDIATVSSRFKELQKFANPSGTGQTVIGGTVAAAGGGSIVALFLDPITAATIALSTGTTIAGARVVSNILAKPQTAAPFATWSKAYAAFSRKPSAAAASVLRSSARALAVAISDDSGNRQDVDRLTKELAMVRRGA